MASQSGIQSGNDRKRGTGKLTFLRQAQIHMIDEALSEVGEFGEVRLIVTKGRLRFVVTQRSHDALQWEEEARNGVRRVEISNNSPMSATGNQS